MNISSTKNSPDTHLSLSGIPPLHRVKVFLFLLTQCARHSPQVAACMGNSLKWFYIVGHWHSSCSCRHLRYKKLLQKGQRKSANLYSILYLRVVFLVHVHRNLASKDQEQLLWRKRWPCCGHVGGLGNRIPYYK